MTRNRNTAFKGDGHVASVLTALWNVDSHRCKRHWCEDQVVIKVLDS